MKAIERLEAALGAAAGTEVALERPGDAAHGDYATNVALRLANARKQAPRAIAEELLAQASALADVDRAEIAGPGFLNLWLAPVWYRDALAEMLAAGPDYGGGSATAPERVQVEMVSANPTGPITVASARNGAYGDSVARLLAFAGHAVEREYYYNDSGAQMDRFRASVEAREELGQALFELALPAEAVEVDPEPLEGRLDLLEHQRHRIALQRGEVLDVGAPVAVLRRLLPTPRSLHRGAEALHLATRVVVVVLALDLVPA